jgi:hypothetical protein
MRSLMVLIFVFAAGFLLGHEFWPEAHEDPDHHLRFHRGRLPYAPEDVPTTRPSAKHGRVLPAADGSSTP